jgi:hypothetical protein
MHSPNDCLDFFQALNERNIRYMMVGMAAVALQGGSMVTDDIDLWVENLADPAFQAAAQSVGGIYIPPINLAPPLVSGRGLDGIDLVLSMSGLGKFDEEYQYVCWMDLESVMTPVLAVERIIISKRAANRPKDQIVLPILEDLVRTRKALE